MKLREILLSADQLELIQGVERDLLRRRRTGTIGGIVALLAAVLQVLIAVVEQDYLQTVGRFFSRLFSGQFDQLIGPEGLSAYELTGLVVLIAGLGTYFLFRRTSFLLRESEEPFRYTFWVKPLTAVSGTPGPRFILHQEDQLHLLHYDLMERLTKRIRRLSLLDVESPGLDAGAEVKLTSHIHIEGQYAIREQKKGKWIIQVTPYVRIGSPSRPITIADPVNYSLTLQKTAKAEAAETNGEAAVMEEVFEATLEADQYRQIVERVYSRVATEVYRQILSDVRQKSALFPTDYLRAVALFHEAKDFERSNTIDAYDYAIELYRESNHYFDIRFSRYLTRLFSSLPWLWRSAARSRILEARARIGLSRSLIYRRMVAALSGRAQNPLFEVPGLLENAISDLVRLHNHIVKKKEWKLEPPSLCWEEGETEISDRTSQYKSLVAYLAFPRDSTFRRSRVLFEQQREALFDACAMAALAHTSLGAFQKAVCFRDSARAVAPDRTQSNGLWLLATAEIEPDMNRKLLLLRQAVELEPEFEIAQYRLAYYSEMALRLRNEIRPERVESVINDYEEVLRINPGNVGALAAQGYLWWLLGDLIRAQEKFDEGLEIKAFVRQTFVGDLYYGLARIAAENTCFNRCNHLYEQAIAADPSVGIYTASVGSRAVTAAYDYIAPEMLQRYGRWKTQVEEEVGHFISGGRRQDAEGIELSLKTVNTVYSYVLNDYGNACLNYFHRFGNIQTLEKAIHAFEEAIVKNPRMAVAYYNLASGYPWYKQGSVDEIAGYLGQAEKLAPGWPVALIASAQSQVRQIQVLINRKKEEREAAKEQRKEKAEQALAAEKETKVFKENQVGRAQDRAQETQATAREIEGRLERLNAEIYESESRIARLDDEIETLQASLRDNVFPKIARIMDQTKLFALFEGLKIDYDGAGVDELLAAAVEKEKFDETDVDALKVWAEILTNNVDSKAALHAARKLCHLILGYYPEDFNATWILYRVDEQLGELEKKEICSQRLVATIENWLAYDPIRYVALYWASEFFTDERYISALRHAIEIEPDKAEYYDLLGDMYYRRLAYEKAIEQYQKAIDLSPGVPDYANRLGNIYYSQGDFQRAVTRYKEAIKIDAAVAAYHSNLAGAYQKLGMWPKAVAAYKRAIKLEPQNDANVNRQGNAYFAQENYRQAIACYEEAIRISPRIVVYYSNLADAYELLEEPGQRVPAFTKAITALQRAYQISQREEYKDHIRRLEEKRRLAVNLGEQALNKWLVVTPVAVEVAADLIPHVEAETAGLRRALNDQIVQMRERITQTMGVRVPGIRFRGNETDMPLGSYLIMINEVPLVMATIAEAYRLFPGSLQEVEKLGLSGQETVNPASGGEAAWIGRSDWAIMEKAGYRLWGFLEYLVQHLEAVIRQNLVEFLGHQEVMNMLEEQLPDVYRQMQDDSTPLSALVGVLQRLVNEGVPISAFPTIVNRFNQLWDSGAAALTIVEAIRSLPVIRPALPGNNGDYAFYRFGQCLEQEIDRAIRVENGQAYLDLEPEKTQAILGGVREAAGRHRPHLALVVKNGRIRIFVKRLIELEFPRFPVLSGQELLADLESIVVGEIDLEQPGDAPA